MNVKDNIAMANINSLFVRTILSKLIVKHERFAGLNFKPSLSNLQHYKPMKFLQYVLPAAQDCPKQSIAFTLSH